jgi:Galactose oxidase, central domain
MTTGRYYHTVTSLPDGTVLIAGGEGNPSSDPATATSAEIYDPATGAFSRTGDMNHGHTDHTATLLLDGRVLLTGGPASAEVYIPSVLMPIPVVRGVRFDRMVVPAGSSYSVDFSGSNLTPEMFYDVRFTSPESNESAVALNWQKGFAENHEAPAGLASGSWKITSVRAHEIETDHTGIFFPVSATITVP